MRIPIGILTGVALLLGASAAQAGNLTWDLTVWNGAYNSGVTDIANLASKPAISPIGTYTYQGPIDFVNNNGQGGSNTFGDFFGSLSSGLTQTSGDSVATLLGLTMSTVGETGGATNSYLEFTSSYTSSTPVMASVTHDDGASLYYGAGNTVAFESADPTSKITSTGMLAAGTDVPLTLVYVESNGAPAVLQATIPTPEPASLAIFASGLLGLTMLQWQRRRQRG